MNRISLLSLAAAALVFAIPSTAQAGTGMFCFSPKFAHRISSGDQTGQTISIGTSFPYNGTTYVCPGISGAKTVPQLYQLGYKVVFVNMIIPTVIVPVTTTHVYAQHQILIEKP
ncbi:hypothetical protein [Montanilutibacter psychrotolerans]|uniref:Uncharacterized protein n=1 Tax=Montanilutibacter psychrotolerans TaxID=1327343 RepID=A0A3M8SWA3_9GAMM|nr:hypothetical protein [Lysobacter psychrotolerans]RNF83130.1 hypothetical protein EER27_11475 [Lysobacter psychrotolerans]